MKNKEWTVTWSIEITAPTAEEAAELARKIQLDPESLATVFCVEGDGKSILYDTLDGLVKSEPEKAE